MNVESTRKGGGRAFAILLVVAGIAAGADQPTIRAVLKPPSDRKSAPQFVLIRAKSGPLQSRCSANRKAI